MKILILMIASSLLVGCNTFMEAQNASTKGAANLYSCEQINSALAAYEADRASFEAYKQIAVMSGLDLSKTPDIDVASYYQTVKNSANIALLMQGCPPRV